MPRPNQKQKRASQGQAGDGTRPGPASPPRRPPHEPCRSAAPRRATIPPPVPIGDQGPGDTAGTSPGRREAPSPQATRSALDAARTAPGQSNAGQGAPRPGSTAQRANRHKSRTGEPKAQARRSAAASGVRPESGTAVQKIGHNTHTRSAQSPYSDCVQIRKVCVKCLYARCPVIVRVSRNHLTNSFVIMARASRLRSLLLLSGSRLRRGTMMDRCVHRGVDNGPPSSNRDRQRPDSCCYLVLAGVASRRRTARVERRPSMSA
jgi:hypothetical protein